MLSGLLKWVIYKQKWVLWSFCSSFQIPQWLILEICCPLCNIKSSVYLMVAHSALSYLPEWWTVPPHIYAIGIMLRNISHPHISAIDYNEQRDGCWAKSFFFFFDEYKVFYWTEEWILPFIRHNFHFGKNIFFFQRNLLAIVGDAGKTNGLDSKDNM